MGLKLYPANVDEDTMILARALGLTNFSEFCRDALSYFISNADRELTPSEIRELSKKFAHEKRAAMLKQQQITGKTDEELAKIAELKEQRRQRILTAMKKEMDARGMYRFRRYMIDENGDYAGIQDDILEAMSKDAGIPVQLCDVLELLKAVP